MNARTGNDKGKGNGNGTHHPGNGHSRFVATISAVGSAETDRKVLDEASFQRTLSLERKRTERSRKPFLLMLLDAGDSPDASQVELLSRITDALTSVTRETDFTGWYRNETIIGLMFTELEMDEKGSVLGTILERVSDSLRVAISLEQFNQISISFHIFPEEWDRKMRQFPNDRALYPDVFGREKHRAIFCAVKRVIDIVGSIFALVLFAPLFGLIATLVKLTSKGPVIFRQERLGQFGKAFTFYKFRTMSLNNSATIHQEFMKGIIHGESQPDHQSDPGIAVVYKMTDDPRITRIGKILRRLSLDELPQFLNVLKGDMSLVGPRPPIAYEYLEYDLWHRRRLLEAKPGITGLWQVNGRSRVRFDDMVRLDLKYGRTWSPWLDLQILARTPRAVLFGNDAF